MSQQSTQGSESKSDGRSTTVRTVKPTTKQAQTKPVEGKPKWPLWLLIGAGVVLPSIVVVGLFKGNAPPIARVIPVAAEASIAQPGVVVQGSLTVAAPTAEAIKPVEKMNLMPAENITPNFVDHVGSENGIRIIYFRDGSRRNLDDFTLQQLPNATRDSITYSQGSNANP
jgi:hypothetical protein